MSLLRTLIATLAVLGLLATMPAHAQTAEQTEAATALVAAMGGAEDLMKKMVDQMAQAYPPAMEQQFREIMEKVDYVRMEEIMVDALSKTYSVEEMAYMTGVYENPLGKAFMDKMPQYMTTAMPAIQQMMMEAMQQ